MASPNNDNFEIRANKVIDSRSMKFTAGAQQPYANVAEALAAIPLTPVSYRAKGLVVFIDEGGSPYPYWFRDGTADGNLVPMNNWVTINTNIDTSYALPAGRYVSGFIVKPTGGTLVAFKIGTTNGGGDISSDMQIDNTVATPLPSSIYADGAPKNIYFGGITGATQIIILKH